MRLSSWQFLQVQKTAVQNLDRLIWHFQNNYSDQSKLKRVKTSGTLSLRPWWPRPDRCWLLERTFFLDAKGMNLRALGVLLLREIACSRLMTASTVRLLYLGFWLRKTMKAKSIWLEVEARLRTRMETHNPWIRENQLTWLRATTHRSKPTNQICRNNIEWRAASNRPAPHTCPRLNRSKTSIWFAKLKCPKSTLFFN